VDRRCKIDWAWVKPLFRAGYSLRMIRAKYAEAHHGIPVSIEAIRSHAKKEGWKKDLTKDIGAAVDRKLAEASITDKTDDAAAAPATDAEFVDAAAKLATGVVLTHRSDGLQLRNLVKALATELALKDKEPRVVGRGQTQQVVMVRSPLKDRAQAVKNLAYALNCAVTIERKSYNLDRAEGGLDGVFLIRSNIPEPDPLPEDI